MKCRISRKLLLFEMNIISNAFKQTKNKNDISNNVLLVVRDKFFKLLAIRDKRMYKTLLPISYKSSCIWEVAVNIEEFKSAIEKMQSRTVLLEFNYYKDILHISDKTIFYTEVLIGTSAIYFPDEILD